MKFGKVATPQRLVYLAGICSFTFFLILSLLWRNLFDGFVKPQLLLTSSTFLYNFWVRNQVPIHLEIYLFNFTNADEFKQDKTVVPNFEEIGPFLFEESREKVDVSWNDFEQTITFNQSKKWVLIPELSRDLSVKITNFNPIAATIAYMSRLWPSRLQREIGNALLNAHEPLLVTASAREWTFDGLSDDFLDMFRSLRKVTEIPIPYNKFGWFYDRNGSSLFDGTFTIKTGESSMDDLGMMVAWNHKNKTHHYVDSCALVYGSTGEITPPLKPLQESLSVFGSDMCSYITLKYNRSLDFEGLPAYEYVGDKSVFDNGTSNPENWCFYLGESFPSGLRNISSCSYGSPAFMSFPHFYLADLSYREKFTGLNPDESKHKFTLIMQPKMGAPLAVKGSFQINLLVQPYEWCDEFREVPKMYIPMLWFKQSVRIPDSYSRILKLMLFVQNDAEYVFFYFAVFIMFCILFFAFWRKSRRPN